MFGNIFHTLHITAPKIRVQDSIEEEYLLFLRTCMLYLCLACVLDNMAARLVVHVVTVVFCLAFCCCRCTVCNGEVCLSVTWLCGFFLISAHWLPIGLQHIQRIGFKDVNMTVILLAAH